MEYAFSEGHRLEGGGASAPRTPVDQHLERVIGLRRPEEVDTETHQPLRAGSRSGGEEAAGEQSDEIAAAIQS